MTIRSRRRAECWYQQGEGKYLSDERKPLQFETAETAAVSDLVTCTGCKQPITSSYFTVGGQVACQRCKVTVERAAQHNPGVAAFVKAVGLGSLAGLAGAAAWYMIRAATGYELGIIALAIGWGVGMGVRVGSGGRGGSRYQVLAIVLTYFWIAANYMPDLFVNFDKWALEGFAEGARLSLADAQAMLRNPSPDMVFAIAGIKVVFAMTLALALPFLSGFKNLMGLLIIGFGLYQAWRINKRLDVAVEGPFSLIQQGAVASA
jgi:hypothetical protein